jgi:CubicO group peptidase (beta-lactamase class C family)
MPAGTKTEALQGLLIAADEVIEWTDFGISGDGRRGRERASATRSVQTNLTCIASPSKPRDLTPIREEQSMTSDTPTNTTTFGRWPHRVIRHGSTVRQLPPHTRSLADLTIEVDDRSLSVSDCMTRCRTAGLLILKDGEIALERYGMESGPDMRREGHSTTKSIVATLVGAALHDGAIGSLDDGCDLHVPRLRGSAYEGVTVRNLMRMCSGVAWDEEGDGRAENGRLELAFASRRPGSMLDLACTLPRAQPQGILFNYSTPESSVLGAVVAAATGRTLADYCAEKIWGPAGMEANAYWVLDADGGQEPGGFGVSACLRDIGRFGLLALEDGAAFNGQRVLPSGWRDLVGQPDSAPTGLGRLTPGSPMGYGYHWWAMPHGSAGIHAGAFLAAGSFGQKIYVHPTERVVAAVQSAWCQHEDPDANAGTWALLGAALRALRAAPT